MMVAFAKVTISTTCVLLVLTLQNYYASAFEITLLDTTTVTGKLGWTKNSVAPADRRSSVGWLEASYTDTSNDILRIYTVCNVDVPNVQNWLRTPYIQRQLANELYVEMKFTMRDCTQFPQPEALVQCKESFKLLYYQAEGDIANAQRPTWDTQTYTMVDAIAADQTFSTQTQTFINSETRAVTVGLHGVYFAFLDQGSCVSLISVRIYYIKCPRVVYNLATYSETSTGSGNSGTVQVAGSCVSNAASDTTPYNFCQKSGNWSFAVGECKCMSGYEPDFNRTKCTACAVNYYKPVTSNDPCSLCPSNSGTSTPGQQKCDCLPGFYRSGSDPSLPCYGSPPPVVNLAVTAVGPTTANLSWVLPTIAAVRKDLYYQIYCSGCGPNVEFNPGTKLNSTNWVLMTGLNPATLYDVIIFTNAVGFSQLSNASASEVKFTTSPTGPQPVSNVQVSVISPEALIVQWALPPGQVSLSYEVVYWINASQPTTINITSSNATLDGLVPGQQYHIKVRALTTAGWSTYSQEALFTTPSAGTSDKSEAVPINSNSSNQSVGIIVGAAIAVIICLLIVIIMVFIYVRRSHTPCNEKGIPDDAITFQNVPWFSGMDGSPSLPHHLTLPLFSQPITGIKTYVDPHTYEDPNQAVREFTKEIDAQFITIESVIGGGEFGDVCKGRLRVPFRSDVTVAIKSLKMGASDKNRLDFLTEASIMGQFDDPNIIYLQGVVTRSQPNMIVMEYMENGALDTYLQRNDNELSVHQLMCMLRGIASGMRYLSEMNYIHRDLAARNILVNAQLVCKVADFGLSREVEADENSGAYTTKGGKIPVRWTAPEAIAYRKFTSASDVWSYGVVMWEVMSYGERPYWNWSNQDVIRAVDKGFRLPPPMGCPLLVYQLMLKCWVIERNMRPRFQEIVDELDSLLRSPECLNSPADYRPHQFINPNKPDLTCYDSVPEWLMSVKMERYLPNFERCGYTSMNLVATLTAQDLEHKLDIVLIGHRRKLLRSIQAFQQVLGTSCSLRQVSDGYVV